MTKKFYPPLLVLLGLLFSVNVMAAEISVTWNSFLKDSPASNATLSGTDETQITVKETTNTTGVNGGTAVDGV